MGLTINYLHIAFYIAAILVSLTLLVHTFIKNRTDKLQNVAFIIMLCIIIVNSSTELCAEFCLTHINISDGAFLGYRIFQSLYFIFHTLLAPVFFLYEASVTNLIKKASLKDIIVLSIPVLILEVIVLTNPLTNIVYYYDETKVFHRNWAEGLIYLMAAFFLAFSVFNLIYYWNAVTTKKRVSLLYFFGVVVAGLMVQLFFPSIKCELFAAALSVMGVMFNVENEDNRIISDMEIYNRTALVSDLSNYITMRNHIEIICIKIRDMDTIAKTGGAIIHHAFMNEISQYLKTLIQRQYIYSTDPSQFVLIVDRGTIKTGKGLVRKVASKYESIYTADELVDMIGKRFEEVWNVGREGLKLNAVQVVIRYPEDISDIDDISFIINNSVPSNIDKKVIQGEDLALLLRKNEIEQAIIRGLETGGFEVYYQPTYNMKDKSIHGAEALLRLNDSRLGMVYPDEFIPVTEQMGFIDIVDDFVLKEVCKFIESGIPSKFGMRSINVNLSVTQCISDGFVEHIVDIVSKFNIYRGMVNFEITESVATDDYGKLNEVIKKMKKYGFRFAMDDYGTGYSNMQSIFSLDFDYVKIDKSILWGADESELGMTILKNSIYMIKQMHRKIVVEGVETEKQVALLEQFDVDVLQGYYFSKPISRDKLIEL